MRSLQSPLALLAAMLLTGSAAVSVAADAAPAKASGSATVESARSALRLRQYSVALEHLRPAAASGDAGAQFLLGEMLLAGVGVAVDQAAARDWLLKAAQQDHAEAAYVLAALLSSDGSENADQARQWLQRSAQLNYPRAIDALRDPRPLLAADRRGDADAAMMAALALYAARSNNVSLLVSIGASAAAARDEFGRGTLASAVTARATAAVEWLLANGADAKQADQFGVTALMLAAELEDGAASANILDQLLKHGARVSAVDMEKRSALFYAARHDRAAAIKLLATAGSTLDATDSRGYTTLDVALTARADAAAAELKSLGVRQSVTVAPRSVHGKFDAAHPGVAYRDWPLAALAAARNDAESLKAQLLAGTPVNSRTPQGDTLLHVAFHAQSVAAMALLVARGADPLAGDRRGRSVLGLSASAKDPAALQLLLAANVAVNKHADNEASALMQAVMNGNVDNARALLAAKADVNAVDGQGNSALSLAAGLTSFDMINLLLGSGADLKQRNRAGQTALWIAARVANQSAVQRLIAARAEVDLADLQGHTPLMMAAAAGHAKVVELLLQAGASLNLLSADGDSALLMAAAAGRADVVPLLARARGVTDKQNRHGDTALIAASRQGFAEVCRALLKAGASSSLRNKSRASAADVARERGFANLADEIDKHS